jgi:hypothetical protein
MRRNRHQTPAPCMPPIGPGPDGLPFGHGYRDSAGRRMLFHGLITVGLSLVAVCMGLVDVRVTASAAEPVLKLEAKIPLGDVRGRIDHLSVDLARQRLFVAEIANGSVSVVDLAHGTMVKHISGLAEPQGVLYWPSTDMLFVALGGDGTLKEFSGESLEPAGSINIGSDADNVHADPAASLLAVGFGNGLALVDPAGNRITTSIPLSGHAEGFAFDPSGQRAYVNIPGRRQIATVDLSSAKVAASWSTSQPGSNFPMAIDGQRVLVGFRSPPSLGIYSTVAGKRLASLPICDDSDDLFVDAKRGLVYVTCGAGEIETLAPDATGYRVVATTATSRGARTGLFIPELDRLAVAVPATGQTPAGIWIYAPMP